MDLQLLSRGQREQLEQPHGIGAEVIVGRDRNSPAIENEPAEPLRLPADGWERETEAFLAELLVELGEEHAGEIADRFRIEEIELHEALDRRFPGPVGV